MMTKEKKKFIAPGSWFSIMYPADWYEFEDTPNTFLFYNPDNWSGNFRISAYRGEDNFGHEYLNDVMKSYPDALPLIVGDMSCAYLRKEYEEEGRDYVTHIWMGGKEDMGFECSFTVLRGMPPGDGTQIVESIEVRHKNKKYPAETIPVRLSEIYRINTAYEWVEHKVKEVLKLDFQGVEDDVENMQKVLEACTFSSTKREVWYDLGITLCVIFANEMEGVEWRTLVDGNREVPVLVQTVTGKVIDPMKLVWSKVKRGEQVNLKDAYLHILAD